MLVKSQNCSVRVTRSPNHSTRNSFSNEWTFCSPNHDPHDLPPPALLAVSDNFMEVKVEAQVPRINAPISTLTLT